MRAETPRRRCTRFSRSSRLRRRRRRRRVRHTNQATSARRHRAAGRRRRAGSRRCVCCAAILLPRVGRATATETMGNRRRITCVGCESTLRRPPPPPPPPYSTYRRAAFCNLEKRFFFFFSFCIFFVRLVIIYTSEPLVMYWRAAPVKGPPSVQQLTTFEQNCVAIILANFQPNYTRLPILSRVVTHKRIHIL